MMIFFLSVACSPQVQVHVVDPLGGPGSDFQSFREAAAAAVDGDVVLLRGGLIDAITVADRTLTVVADSGADVVTDQIGVRNTAGHWALIQGIRGELSLAVADGAALAWFEDCRWNSIGFQGTNGFIVGPGDFVATRCEFQGPPPLGDRVLQVFPGARVHLHDCTIEGRPTPTVALIEGQEALSIDRNGGFAELFGSRVIGAPGSGGSLFFPDGLDGGVGLALHGGSAIVHDSTLVGGTGGVPFGPGTPGQDGPAVLEDGGQVLAGTAQARSLQISSPAREGEPVLLSVVGRPGDLVWLRYALAPAAGRTIPGLTGEFLLPAPSAGGALFLGVLPASGALALTVTAPALTGSEEARVFFAQAIVRDAVTRRFVVSSPSALIVLDAAL